MGNRAIGPRTQLPTNGTIYHLSGSKSRVSSSGQPGIVVAISQNTKARREQGAKKQWNKKPSTAHALRQMCHRQASDSETAERDLDYVRKEARVTKQKKSHKRKTRTTISRSKKRVIQEPSSESHSSGSNLETSSDKQDTSSPSTIGKPSVDRRRATSQ